MNNSRCSLDSNCPNLNIVFQNVCGILNKKDELEVYLNTLESQPSYVCLCEHFLTPLSVQCFNFNNYGLVSYNVRHNKKRGGTLILAKDGVTCEETDVGKKLYKRDSFEVCTVKDITTGMNICCCYRVPNTDTLNSFFQQLECLLDCYFDKKCIILGDFNLDILLNGKHQTELLTLLKCYNLRHLINCPTFIRGDSSSSIDNIFSNFDMDLVTSIEVDHNYLADGYAALICRLKLNNSINTNNSSKNIVIKECRTFNTKNKTLFRELILKENWLSKGINSFIDTLQNLFITSFPVKRKVINTTKENKFKWITRGIKVSSQMKRFLNSVNKTLSHHSIIDYRTRYIRIYKKVLILAKKQSVQNQIEQADNKPKKIWEIVNRNINKHKHHKDSSIKLMHEGHIVNNSDQIANIFCDFFCRDPTVNLGSDIGKAEAILKENQNTVFKKMPDITVTEYNVYKVIQKMPSKKSAGYDGMPLSVIKDNIELLSLPLSHFFNSCLTNSIFPEQLSLAIIHPIYKKGDIHCPKNYRPISILRLII